MHSIVFGNRNIAWVASLIVLLALALVVVACSEPESGEEEVITPTATTPPLQNTPVSTEVSTDTSTPVPTPVPTLVPTVEPTPTPAPAASQYPLEIVDMLGRAVEIPVEPMRIVSISPTATEMLYAAGGTAIARDSSSTFPAAVLDLPELGGAYSPSFEAVAAQGADLILIEALSQARFLEPLSRLGPPVVTVRAASLNDVEAGIKLIGEIIGESEIADQAAEDIAERVSASLEDLREGLSAVILISDADRNLYAAKPQSYPGAIASMLRLLNPAADLPDSGTFPGFAQISVEQLLTMDPDFLFTITPAPEPAPRLSAMLPRIPGFSNLKSIKNGQMHELDHVIFLRNQGPRIAEAVETMAEIIGSTQ